MEKQKRFSKYINTILILLVVALAVIPLIIAKNAEFEGADAIAEEAISEINADYQPWFSPIFQPPSGEVESLLFSIQAAIGAGVIGYGFGYMKGKKEDEKEKSCSA